MKLNQIFETVEYNHREFLKWKRKNVTLRGVKEFGKENGVYGSMGKGLYTAFLSNKSMAKEYGDVFYVVNAIPKNPLVLDSINSWEIWSYNKLYHKYGGRRDFEKTTNLNDAIKALGYDGVVIKGREMVNYSPENIQYFKTDRELENYYYSEVLNEELTYRHANIDGVEDDEYEIGVVSEEIKYDEFLKYGVHDDLDVNKSHLKKLINDFKKLPNTLTLYRVVFLENKNQLNQQELGSHYVLNKNDLSGSHYSQPHLNSKGQPFILTVKAPKSNIDMVETFKTNMQFPNEKEITLKNKGMGSKLISIKPFNSKSYDIGNGFDDDDYYGNDDYYYNDDY